jgi:hypothetical protein
MDKSTKPNEYNFILLATNKIEKGGEPTKTIINDDLVESLKQNPKSYPILEVYLDQKQWKTDDFEVIEVLQEENIEQILIKSYDPLDEAINHGAKNPKPKDYRTPFKESIFFDNYNSDFDQSEFEETFSDIEKKVINSTNREDTQFNINFNMDPEKGRITYSFEHNLNNSEKEEITHYLIDIPLHLARKCGPVRSINGLVNGIVSIVNKKLLLE